MNDVWPVPPPPIARVPETVGGAKVNVPLELVMALEMVRPLKEVAEEVASVIAPVCAVPYVCAMEETPLLMEDVATHVGTPFRYART